MVVQCGSCLALGDMCESTWGGVVAAAVHRTLAKPAQDGSSSQSHFVSSAAGASYAMRPVVAWGADTNSPLCIGRVGSSCRMPYLP